ncbi:hypothetical protein [Streptomyces sp. MZ04]|uniref:hypothetical protein n=1 Tax=Streptomyces sp. MZ04 TaxID=2559236 RepID=UPI00107E71F1|nr:hypothetical protein [Streptomyces sp. MZ04]TGB13196.1 hypothetical protein E2651_10190 [Streptomyces sp. MZ04]
MKTVKSAMFRNIANPRRTTLAHLTDAQEVKPAADQPEHALELPTQTANPKRTILMDAPEEFTPETTASAV